MYASTVITAITSSRLLPVAVVDSAEQAVDLAGALVRGGMTTMEVTLRTGAALAAIQAIHSVWSDLVVGAGTVLSADEAERSIAAGASFIVSPGLDAEIVSVCQSQETVVIPGVCTPSEVMQARRLGLSVLKFFPAEQMGGAAMLSALQAVFADVRFVPTGGISPSNLGAYLSLSNVAACGMSWLADIELVRSGNFGDIEQRAREACGLLRMRS